MRISCIQMEVSFAAPEINFSRAEELIRKAVADEAPDVIVLPETWNTGFFPRENLSSLCDADGRKTVDMMSALASELNVNLVAGSVATKRDGACWNTAYVFDRRGACIASYDKTHLFTPMGEDQYFTPGDRLCRFTLDGVQCALVICYDIRFPELTRTLVLPGLDALFMVSQWPLIRIAHLQALTTARAIENQMFLVCCNACGTAGETVYGGNSRILDPWGNLLCQAGAVPQIISAELSLSILQDIRSSINVFRDRRPALYQIN